MAKMKIDGHTTVSLEDPLTKEKTIVTSDPAMAKKLQEDPGFCGVGVFQTGKWDPYWKFKACPKHDKDFLDAAEGRRDDSGIETAAIFTRDATSTFLKSLYGVVAYPLYVGAIWAIGLPRWLYLKSKAPKK